MRPWFLFQRVCAWHEVTRPAVTSDDQPLVFVKARCWASQKRPPNICTESCLWKRGKTSTLSYTALLGESCPAGQEGGLCQHIVAVLLSGWAIRSALCWNVDSSRWKVHNIAPTDMGSSSERYDTQTSFPTCFWTGDDGSWEKTPSPALALLFLKPVVLHWGYALSKWKNCVVCFPFLFKDAISYHV